MFRSPRRTSLSNLLAVAAMLALASAGWAQPATITEEGVIHGTMKIDFKTRTTLDTSGSLKPNSPGIGVKDVYSFGLNVAKTIEFAGDITRQPNLYTKTLARSKQEAQLNFNVNISVLNPRDLTQKKLVGKMVGTVPIDTASGAYDLARAKGEDKPLRIAVDPVGAQPGFTDYFGGKLVGKAEKKDNLASYTYKRLIGNKTVQITVKKVDPMKFDNIELAKGPAEIYPHTRVNGRLDYDYETGNWLTEGITFHYNLDGKDVEDIVTGTIKWIEARDRATTGKGHYEFNLRFNEAKNKSASTEAAAFEKMSAEDAFFAVDTSIPTLTGKIEFVDTFISGGTTPSASAITYNLNANKLTKQQVVNFFKLWLICVGPTNDE